MHRPTPLTDQYRMCKLRRVLRDIYDEPTEGCFERGPLRFANGASVVRFSGGGARVLPAATDVTEGVRPAGSAWRRLPIPACACDFGSNCRNASSTAHANDTQSAAQSTAYVSPGDAAYEQCRYGLQFAAAHLKDGTWPEGYAKASPL